MYKTVMAATTTDAVTSGISQIVRTRKMALARTGRRGSGVPRRLVAEDSVLIAAPQDD
jgi:hypothetical protein